MKGSLLRARLYVTGLALAAAGLTAYLLAGAEAPRGGELLTALVLGALLAAVGLRSFRILPDTYFSLDMSVAFAAVLLLEPGVAVLAACAGTVASDLILRTRPRALMVNAADTILGAGCAGLVLEAGGYAGSLAPLWDGRYLAFVLAAATVLALTNVILMATWVAIETGRSWLSCLRHAGFPVSYCLEAGLGLLAAVIAVSAPWALALLAAPGYAAYVLVERQMRRRRRAEEALIRTEARLIEAQRIAHVGSWEWLLGGEQMMWSDETYRIFGYEPQGCPPTRGEYLEHVHLEDRRRVRAALDEALSAGEPLDIEHRVVSIAGRTRWLHARGEVERDAGGGSMRLVGTLLDVTERKEVEARLRDAERRYRALVEGVPAVIYVQEPREGEAAYYDVTYMSPRVEELLGYPARAFVEEPGLWDRLVHPEDRERVRTEDERTDLTGEPFSTEYRMLRRDGRTVWIRDEATLVRGERGNPLFRQGVMTDVTERKILEDRLQHQAHHDSLTGLPNRALFADRLGVALSRADRRGGRVAVLFLDLDGFKRVNDTLGHASGDELLREVSSRISGCLRPHDSVARMGGDEFVLLLDDTDEASAAGVAGRVMEAVRAPYEIAGRGVRVDASVGIALSGKGSDPDGLLRAADVAMYEAKRDGKGRYRFHEGPDVRTAASR